MTLLCAPAQLWRTSHDTRHRPFRLPTLQQRTNYRSPGNAEFPGNNLSELSNSRRDHGVQKAMSSPSQAITEPKPCPHCGAKLTGPHGNEDGLFWMHPGIRTSARCIHSGRGFWEGEALDLWNMRADDDPAPAQPTFYHCDCLPADQDNCRNAKCPNAGLGPSKVGISRCNKCGAEYPSAPAGTIHKCGACSGGYCSPITKSGALGAAIARSLGK